MKSLLVEVIAQIITLHVSPVIHVYLDKLEEKSHRSVGGASPAEQDKPDGFPAG